MVSRVMGGSVTLQEVAGGEVATVAGDEEEGEVTQGNVGGCEGVTRRGVAYSWLSVMREGRKMEALGSRGGREVPWEG